VQPLLHEAVARLQRESTRIDLGFAQQRRLQFQAANMAQMELCAMLQSARITGVAMWSEANSFGSFDYLAVGFTDWLPVMVAANGMCCDLIGHRPNSTAQMRDAALNRDYLVLGVLG
jgi:hypothetical protein